MHAKQASTSPDPLIIVALIPIMQKARKVRAVGIHPVRMRELRRHPSNAHGMTEALRLHASLELCGSRRNELLREWIGIAGHKTKLAIIENAAARFCRAAAINPRSFTMA